MKSLRLSTKIYYLFGDIGVSTCLSAIAFFMLFFFTDVAHLDPALVGTVLLIGKLWDAVNDPLFGWISDRTQSRFGKRRVYLLFGTIPLGLSFVLLWMIPTGASNALAIVWLLGTFFLFYSFITIVSVSYYAMTPELTRDYDERTSLTTFRMIGGSAGYMAGAALPPLIAGLFVTEQIGWRVMGLCLGVFTVLCLFITAFGVRIDENMESPPSTMPPIKSILSCFKNRPYNYILIQGAITGMSFMLIMSYMSFYLTYQLDMRDQIPLIMALYIGTIALFLFFWKWLADRWAKGPTYALGLFIAFGTLALSFFLPQGRSNLIYVILLISAFGMSAQWVLPWSILPDVVEYDELMTGERREGMYYGLRGLLGKISDAVGIFVGGWVLKLFAFVPETAQTPETLFGIRLFFGPIPALLIFISLPLLIWFPINRQIHAETLEKLKLMRFN
ncbi:glycoside-pentoside-hexuronide (GPH):cation symporter [bacterium]|nr:glycoside-pentoside-hexuronide (GPH):cation symporter [bacterium]